MSDREQTVVRAEEDVSDGRTASQEVAAGRAAWTPFAALGSVIVVIGVLVAIVVAVVALAYFLA